MKQQLIKEMKKVFGSDNRRIRHALSVLKYAEQIQAEQGGDMLIVQAAAILHDIGIHRAERKYGSTAGKYQEIEGPPIARKILQKYDLPAESVEHICRIIANHHTARDIDTTEFRIVRDADWLVNIPDEHAALDSRKLRDLIGRVFKTRKGAELATGLFLNE